MNSYSGCVAVSMCKGLAVIDNTQNGSCLYQLAEPLQGPIQTFLTGPLKV